MNTSRIDAAVLVGIIGGLFAYQLTLHFLICGFGHGYVIDMERGTQGRGIFFVVDFPNDRIDGWDEDGRAVNVLGRDGYLVRRRL